jgi:zinc transporter, ZIP family
MWCWTPPAAPPGLRCKPSWAGAVAMLTDTPLPEAYKVEGMWTGSLVVAGFAISLPLSAIE